MQTSWFSLRNVERYERKGIVTYNSFTLEVDKKSYLIYIQVLKHDAVKIRQIQIVIYF